MKVISYHIVEAGDNQEIENSFTDLVDITIESKAEYLIAIASVVGYMMTSKQPIDPVSDIRKAVQIWTESGQRK